MAEDFISRLDLYMKACYPILWVTTHEEPRVTRELRGFIADTKTSPLPKTLYEWNVIDGLYQPLPEGKIKSIGKDTNDPTKLFPAITDLLKGGFDNVFILKDFHLMFERQLNRPNFICAIKNLIPAVKVKRAMLLFTAPEAKFPNELSKEIHVVDYQLPGVTAIKAMLTRIVNGVNKLNENVKGKEPIQLPADKLEKAAEAALGLTLAEIENSFSYALVANKTITETFIASVFSEKIQQVKKGGRLNHLKTELSFDQVGGLAGVKKWIAGRKIAFTPEGKQFKLPMPKGIGLAGVPGCGKTLTAKAIAHELGMPLFHLDLGSLFNDRVGGTEQNFIQVMKTIDTIGKCVIFIDEIEKYLSKQATSGSGDSGTSSRSFGSFLHWLSEREEPAFIVYTSNNHMILPPEHEERKTIFEIQFKAFERDTKDFDLAALASAADKCSGAEIKSIIKDAAFAAASEGKHFQMKHIVDILVDFKPQAEIKKEEIQAMRDAGKGKLRSAH
jgi:AAA+ superfamily predicted ATPase